MVQAERQNFSASRSTSTIHIAMCLKTNSWISVSAQLARTSVQSMFCTYRSKRLARPAWKIAQTRLRVFSTMEKYCKNCHCSPISLSHCKTKNMMRCLGRIKNQIFSDALMWTDATMPIVICWIWFLRCYHFHCSFFAL